MAFTPYLNLIMRRLTKIIIYSIFCLGMYSANAQQYLSPFSKFGLGELQPDATVRQRAMGETSIATMDSNLFSISNPASYSRMSSFCFETALNSRFYEIQSPDDKYSNKDYLIPYFAFALPLDSHLRWGLSFGLRQYSKIGFQFQQAYSSPLSYHEIYTGSGGYTKFYIGSSIQLIKNLFIGGNIGYFFGKQAINQRVEFDSASPVSLHRDINVNIGNLVFDLGTIYRIKLKNQHELQFGFTYSLPANLLAHQDVVANTYVNLNGSNFTSDSVYRALQVAGRVMLPAKFGVGAQWKSKKWMLAADYKYQSWTQFRFFQRNDSLNNLSAISFGSQYTPAGDKDNFLGSTKYLARMSYRAGVRLAQTYYNINNNQPTDLRFTFGLGLPVGYRGSAIDVAFEFGQIGSLNNNDIQQRYFNVAFGFHLYDPGWFYRRKID
jgi:hypothetical protein